jgi:hypothetical protein
MYLVVEGIRIKTKQKHKKHNTMCVGQYYPQTSTNNVNKTWALLQTTGGKDEPTFTVTIFMYQAQLINTEILNDKIKRNNK